MAAPLWRGSDRRLSCPAVRPPKPAAPFQFLVILMAGWIHRRQPLAIAYLQAENRVLRERLGTRRLRFTDAERRLVAEKAEGLGRTMLAELATLATPETILRWYRRLIAAKYDEPAPRRGKTLSWSTFLRAHWGAIAAADFFTVEVLTVGGLVRYFVFFVIDLKTRRVHVAGVSNSPDGAWMAQVARNLTDAASGFLKDGCHLIVDRDPLYTAHFKAILASANVELLRLPARSPNLNAYAERFVGSIKSESCVTSCRLASGTFEPSCGNTSSTITTSAITKASTTSSRCRSGNPARERSDATNASAAY